MAQSIAWKCNWCGENVEEGTFFCDSSCEEQDQAFVKKINIEFERNKQEKALSLKNKARIRTLHQRIIKRKKKLEDDKQEYFKLIGRTNNYETDVFHTYDEKDDFIRKLENKFGSVSWK